MSTRTRLHFSRFEFKYLLPRKLRDEVEGELGHFVELDPFVADRSDQRYFVRSLYWDDPVLTAFFDKVDGMHTRHKFRIRTYAGDPSDGAPRFLEVKGRYNNLVFKHRTPLRDDDYDPHVGGELLPLQVLRQCEASAVRDRFEFDLHRKRLRPVALVDYLRRPYVSKFDPEFRLTFDEQLATTRTDALFPSSRSIRRRVLSGYTVMELKFRHHVPSWFHRIIQAYQLRRVSISKICYATQTLGLASDPS